MFPVAVIACGMSLLPLSDSNVRVWDLDHPGLNNPVIGPRIQESIEQARLSEKVRREKTKATIIRDLRLLVPHLLATPQDLQGLFWMQGYICRELGTLRQLDEDAATEAATEEANRRAVREYYEKELLRLPDFMHRMACAAMSRGIDPADFIWTHAIISSSLQKLGKVKAAYENLERDR